MVKLTEKKHSASKNADALVPLSVPELGGNEWGYVKECLDTGWVSSVGAYVDRFERAVAEYVGCKYAVACASGTAALHIALLVGGIKQEEEVIVPTLTFAAPAFAIRYVGAWPVFMDVDGVYWQMDSGKLKDFLSTACKRVRGKLVNRQTGRVVRAILPVHVLGHPVDMAPLLELARQYDLGVIEDAAESIGAEYGGKKVGSFGRLACFSFNGNKVITCGGGGMLVTDDRKMAERARYLTTQAKLDPVEYLHDEIGYNYRLTNVQAAIGLAQLEQLDAYIHKKKKIAGRYHESLSGIAGITLPQEASWAKSIWWLYTVLVDKKAYGEDSRGLMHRLAKQGVQARPFWHPLHSQKVFSGCSSYGVEVANDLYRRALSLPSSVGLCRRDQERVIAIIRRDR